MELLIGGTIVGALTVAYNKYKRTIPDGVKAVKPFYAEKYVGKWYEIARFDLYYEKNMNNTTANYTLCKDGSIDVTNSGYNYEEKKVQSVNGKAYFVNGPDEGMLKVSFFGPFYSGYNVVAIDPDYKYSLVIGKDLSLLWILSRETTIPDDVKTAYLELAKSFGCDISKLIWVDQSGIPNNNNNNNNN